MVSTRVHGATRRAGSWDRLEFMRASASVGVAVVCLSSLCACSADDTAVGAADAGVDATVPKVEAGVEAGTDAEAASDAPIDAPADALPDAADGGVTDAPIDAPDAADAAPTGLGCEASRYPS